jgi:hypothetical protein
MVSLTVSVFVVGRLDRAIRRFVLAKGIPQNDADANTETENGHGSVHDRWKVKNA